VTVYDRDMTHEDEACSQPLKQFKGVGSKTERIDSSKCDLFTASAIPGIKCQASIGCTCVGVYPHEHQPLALGTEWTFSCSP
jgi:hypothetical protein